MNKQHLLNPGLLTTYTQTCANIGQSTPQMISRPVINISSIIMQDSFVGWSQKNYCHVSSFNKDFAWHFK